MKQAHSNSLDIISNIRPSKVDYQLKCQNLHAILVVNCTKNHFSIFSDNADQSQESNNCDLVKSMRLCLYI